MWNVSDVLSFWNIQLHRQTKVINAATANENDTIQWLRFYFMAPMSRQMLLWMTKLSLDDRPTQNSRRKMELKLKLLAGKQGSMWKWSKYPTFSAGWIYD
jgi:hypothetical protein